MNQKFDTLPFPAQGGAAQQEGEFELEPERGRPMLRGGAFRAGAAGTMGGKGRWRQGGMRGPQPQRGHHPGHPWPHHRPYYRGYYNAGLWPYDDTPVMHPPYCDCSQCGGVATFDVLPFGATQDYPGLPFSADREQELAMELLSVSSEAEMEQFLGNVFSSVWNGVKKVASPLGGVLKAVAKRALPYVGGALGSLIPIPGVGTALGRAVGSVVSQALEMEFEGMAPQQQEFEAARRFVRLAGTAAQLAGQGDGSPASVRTAVLVAARRHVPALTRSPRAGRGVGQGGSTAMPAGVTGRWRRRGNRIVLSGDF